MERILAIIDALIDINLRLWKAADRAFYLVYECKYNSRINSAIRRCSTRGERSH